MKKNKLKKNKKFINKIAGTVYISILFGELYETNLGPNINLSPSGTYSHNRDTMTTIDLTFVQPISIPHYIAFNLDRNHRNSYSRQLTYEPNFNMDPFQASMQMYNKYTTFTANGASLPFIYSIPFIYPYYKTKYIHNTFLPSDTTVSTKMLFIVEQVCRSINSDNRCLTTNIVISCLISKLAAIHVSEINKYAIKNKTYRNTEFRLIYNYCDRIEYAINMAIKCGLAYCSTNYLTEYNRVCYADFSKDTSEYVIVFQILCCVIWSLREIVRKIRTTNSISNDDFNYILGKVKKYHAKNIPIQDRVIMYSAVGAVMGALYGYSILPSDYKVKNEYNDERMRNFILKTN